MQPDAATILTDNLAAAWNAALAAANAARAADSNEAWRAVMMIEEAIAATPVRSEADAVLQLRVAAEMAARQGVADDPSWTMVRTALAGMNRLADGGA